VRAWGDNWKWRGGLGSNEVDCDGLATKSSSVVKTKNFV